MSFELCVLQMCEGQVFLKEAFLGEISMSESLLCHFLWGGHAERSSKGVPAPWIMNPHLQAVSLVLLSHVFPCQGF